MMLQTRLSVAENGTGTAPVLYFSREAWNRKRTYVRRSSPNEVNGFCYVERSNDRFMVQSVDDVFITKQTVSPGSSHFTGTTYGKALYQAHLDGRPEEELRLQWHSHGRSSAYHSDTDLDTIESFAPTMDWFISLVTNEYGHVVARLDMFRPYRIGVEMDVVVYDIVSDDDEQLVDDQLADLVTVLQPLEAEETTIFSSGTFPSQHQLALV